MSFSRKRQDHVKVKSLYPTGQNLRSQKQILKQMLLHKIISQGPQDMSWWRCAQDLLAVPTSPSSTDSLQVQPLHTLLKSPVRQQRLVKVLDAWA